MAATSALPSPLTFGLGCFAFEMTRGDTERVVKFQTWADEVTSALCGIPSIEKVDVHLDRLDLNRDEWSVGAQRSGGPPEVQFFEPDLTGSQIAFEVSIPKRLHPELLDGQTHECEKFRVETLYEYRGPCSFVTCLDGPGDGALAVRLLWRFLRREIPRSSESVVFTNLGPSPFHARFALAPSGHGAVEPVQWEKVGTFGYTAYSLTYDAGQYASIEDAYDDVQFRLSHELSLFYDLVRLRNWSMEMSSHLNNATSALVSRHHAKGLKAAVGRVFRSGADARTLGLETLQARLELGYHVEYARDAVRDTYSQTKILGCLREFVDEYIPASENVAFKSALDVVHFAEGTRTKELEIAVISASTFLGGLAGAVAALVAGS